MHTPDIPRHTPVIPRAVAESTRRLDSATARGMTIRGAPRPLYANTLHGAAYAWNKSGFPFPEVAFYFREVAFLREILSLEAA
jgi:hypothetical protein